MKIQKSKYPFSEPKGGFDLRMVRYEEVHSIREIDFDELVNIMNAKARDRILNRSFSH